MPLTITLIRHGQTPHNFERKIQTRTDVELNNLGVIQSNILGELLCENKFTRVYCSDLKRAKLTTERILRNNRHQIPQIVEDIRLRERDFGDWEGESEDDVENLAQELGIRVHRLQPPNGETYEDYAEKGLAFFKDVCQVAREDSFHHNVLIVTHCGWLLTIIDSILGNPKMFQVKNLSYDDSAMQIPGNASVTQIRVVKSPIGVDPPVFTLTFDSYYDDRHLKLSQGGREFGSYHKARA